MSDKKILLADVDGKNSNIGQKITQTKVIDRSLVYIIRKIASADVNWKHHELTLAKKTLNGIN